ncbi:DUF2339 domain-containing protein [Thiobaca trueperi]|uniref:Putative membrane protein n=1 Tax=Thiobaca trueperi TaxID=127458 RepID=A0A4R3N008_9GAMM|nr:DUF2339 domain-containing protein [Thiobaca trueperi]TCT21321.1 putative membrane protein [Thiobaca trueperi]
MFITILFTLAGLAVGFWRDEPLLDALLGFLLGRVMALDLSRQTLAQQVAALRTELLRVRALARSAADRVAIDDPAEPAQGVRDQATPTGPAMASAVTPDRDPDSEPLSLDLDWEPAPEPVRHQPRGAADSGFRPTPRPLPETAQGIGWIMDLRDWFQRGNLFVRVGILLLFLGVGFLLKYAVDQEWLVFTLELRLAAVAAAGLGLLGLGWSQRERRRDYALLLQGAAIGILYLDVYGAYQLAHLLSAGTAFVLLALIGLLAAALAVIQNAHSLAWFGFAGGFLAPIVAASGRDDHIALFGYYALLNLAILAVAWFKSWRALNLLGFGFTFGIAVIWGVLRYEPERFATTAPFLLLFFLFYVSITVLETLRQPARPRGYLDTTLLFGTPILTFACQVELVRHIEYGIAWSAVAMGVFYLFLGWRLPRRDAAQIALLSQAFIALGVIFLSVAIPFALAAETTAGVWALEGAGLVWIGARQGRPSIRAFGLILQAGAAVALAAAYPFPDALPFLNGGYLGAAMIAIAGVISAWWLDRDDPDKPAWERGGAPWLLIWGLIWWFGAGLAEWQRSDVPATIPAHFLWYGVCTALIAEVIASRLSWRLLHRAQAAFPLVGLVALWIAFEHLAHPAVACGELAWPLFFVAGYLSLWRIERREAHPSLAWSHAVTGLLLLGVLQWEVVWRLLEQMGVMQGWRVATVALVPLLGLSLLTTLSLWPLHRWPFVYRILLGGTLAVSLLLWIPWSSHSPGGAAPWPWLPLLNPLDGMLALVLLALWQWWQGLGARKLIRPHRDTQRLVWALLGSLAFLWINLALLRALHHLWAIPYDLDALFASNLAQMAVSVLWGLVGVGLLLVARARQSRGVWMSAALILAAVVVKLFLVDLAASGTIERIVSFLAVGGLLVGIGWLSPLPPRGDGSERRDTV